MSVQIRVDQGLRQLRHRLTRTVAPQPRIPNLTLVKDQIRDYYGDWVDAEGRHRYSPDSQWTRDVTRVCGRAHRFLARRLAEPVTDPVLILDIDDTALTTYEYQANTGFGHRQNREVLPAVEPVRDLARYAHERGVAIFFITERRVHRFEDSMANLLAAGFPRPVDIYLRAVEPPYPPYLCEPGCRTVVYKSGARAYIESLGHTILANIGDQHSDLDGGYAERVFKLPNPMYHIP